MIKCSIAYRFHCIWNHNISQSASGKSKISDFDISPAIRSISFDSEGEKVFLKAVVSAQEPTMNPELLPAALTQLDTADLVARLATLTPQQMRVLQLLRQGRLNKQIAHDLDVGETTVKAHVSEILRKLGVHSRTQAVIEASRIDFDQFADLPSVPTGARRG